MFRPPSSTFDSAIRSRYFPGGPTPEGLESDMMFKSLSGETDQLRARRESEGEMMTDSRYSVFLLRNDMEKVKTSLYWCLNPPWDLTWPDLTSCTGTGWPRLRVPVSEREPITRQTTSWPSTSTREIKVEEMRRETSRNLSNQDQNSRPRICHSCSEISRMNRTTRNIEVIFSNSTGVQGLGRQVVSTTVTLSH